MIELLAAIPRIFVENPLFVVEALLTLAALFLVFDARKRGGGRAPGMRWLNWLARRRAWLLEADRPPLKLHEYSGENHGSSR